MQLAGRRQNGRLSRSDAAEPQGGEICGPRDEQSTLLPSLGVFPSPSPSQIVKATK